MGTSAAIVAARPFPPPDAGAGELVLEAPPATLEHVALYHHRTGHRHRRHVGYAPRHLAAAAQAWLDAHPEGGAGLPWAPGRRVDVDWMRAEDFAAVVAST